MVRTVSSEGRLRAIVRSAAELFDRHGYAQVSMADIAAAVGIQKPTLYHYVDSKDQILALIHEEFMGLVFAAAARRAGEALAPAEALRATMADILRLMESHRGHVRVFFEHHRELPEGVRASVTKQRDRYAAGVQDIVRTGIRAGVFRDVDVELTTLAVFGMCNWAYQWYQPGGALRPEEVASTFADLLLDGLRRT